MPEQDADHVGQRGSQPGEVMARICFALSERDKERAGRIARAEYAYEPLACARATFTPAESLRMFIRDGFLDRYSGRRLVFPGALRVVSQLLPDEFPSHPNRETGGPHIACWELYPTVDYVVPLARGGPDDDDNRVTTCMLKHTAKSQWTLDEMSWALHPPGDIGQWDGLLGWFVEYADSNAALLGDDYLSRWHRAATAALKTAT
ncbi:HNH endonuclease [Candidatus Poribacteria bacterium]|jgi:hypothetical protein|nr:HNH endonuclease [Candidatus Poribacteria bacterium]MBT5710490.1 HNH endonuclease [Candidatus Poribacteria bacterium]MBT7098918.1 HNH endonuclease [Candidatus Poribacteria bacterium]MBT7805325.1 HNH endonuclease [Candidatus Poribacteria bacterium]